MDKKKFENWMRVIIGMAKRNNATDDEISILVKAFGLCRKYWPTLKKKEG